MSTRKRRALEAAHHEKHGSTWTPKAGPVAAWEVPMLHGLHEDTHEDAHEDIRTDVDRLAVALGLNEHALLSLLIAERMALEANEHTKNHNTENQNTENLQ